jgi:hypothetical protein
VGYRPTSSPTKGVYDPKAVVLHAALLRQAFAHCAISLTAASRRSLGRLSVPVWGTTLSGPLPVVGWVSRYLTYYLMGRSPLPQPPEFPRRPLAPPSVCGISRPFERLSPAEGQVSYVLRTRSPLGYIAASPFDLHVLGTPPAFILSQDQTLRHWFAQMLFSICRVRSLAT